MGVPAMTTPGRIRRVGVWLSSLLGSLALVYIPWLLAGSTTPAVTAAYSPPPSTEVYATVREWSVQPNLVHLPANSPVTLVFDDRGQLAHELVVPELHLDVVARPGKQVRVNVSGAPVGVYPWTCVLPEHQSAGMQGWLVVGGTLDEHVQHGV